MDNKTSLFDSLNATNTNKTPKAIALGARRSKGGKCLDVSYSSILWAPNEQIQSIIEGTVKIAGDENQHKSLSTSDIQTLIQQLENQSSEDINKLKTHLKQVAKIQDNHAAYFETDPIIYIAYNLDDSICSIEEAYLKLQLISQRFIKPHGCNLDKLFGTLQNIAWTNKGPILPEDVDEERLKYIHTTAPLETSHVDKFPYLVNYHIPKGVRIASGSQVRLGAYLGEGTTIMPAGYVNFNAGTIGHAMIEGKVSPQVSLLMIKVISVAVHL